MVEIRNSMLAFDFLSEPDSYSWFERGMPFTASDGTIFKDRAAYRRYEFELSYTFRSIYGSENSKIVLRKEPGSIDGQPFEIENLKFCDVLLLDYSEAVQIDNLTNCRFVY